jgi:uncharacterized protein (DUF779 family)
MNSSNRILTRSLEATLLFALLVPSPAHATWPTNAAVQVPICTQAGDQFSPVGCSDGAGGAIYAWVDYRSGNADVFAQRISVAGVPLWTGDGVVVCNAAGDQGRLSGVPALSVVSDGSGGALIAWEDRRTSGSTGIDGFVQRLNPNGAAMWTGNGVAITTAAGNQTSPSVFPDGIGGCFVLWLDPAGFGSIGLQRVFANGTPVGPAGGIALVAGVSGNTVSDIERGVSDGANGYYLAFQRFNLAAQQQWVLHGTYGMTVQWANLIDSQSSGGSSVRFDDIVGDGQGGVIVLDDWYNGSPLTPTSVEIYRASPGGLALYQVPVIATTGVLSSTQQNASAVPDGNGGAYVSWQDSRNSGSTGLDIYAQYVSGSGALQLGSNGLAVCTAPGDQTYSRGCSDGSTGAMFAWEDRRGSNADTYAMRLTPNGLYWISGGLPVELVTGQQYQPWPVADANGGAIVAWSDSRTGGYDIYANRIDRSGYMGDPAPAMAGVKDVPNDQGGYVKVQWKASYLDADPIYFIGSYTVWRSIPPNLAQQLLACGTRLLAAGEDPSTERGGAIETSTLGAQLIYWEYVGSQPASGSPAYSYDSPTTSDSTTASNPRTLFRVIARPNSGTPQWSSQPDSGYSVDNLSPATPSPFLAASSGGSTSLHWGANYEADLYGYRLYRGAGAGFVPGPSNLLAAKPDTGYVDVGGGAGDYYKLSAIDVHGNESGFATLAPSGNTDVVTQPGASLAFAPVSPNPAHGPTTLRFTLPEPRDVELVVTDLGGRRVATLSREHLAAGAQAIEWSGRDATGRAAPSGIYFATLVSGGERLVRRFALFR